MRSFFLTLSLLLILAVPALSQTDKSFKVVPQTADSTLSKSDLIQLRKEILLQEINHQLGGGSRRFLHRWELRLLLLTLIGGYLFLRVKNESFKELRWWGWILAASIVGASYLYDLQLASLDARVSDRLNCMYEQLYSLPAMYYYQLEHLSRVPPFKDKILRDYVLDPTASVWSLRFSQFLNLDVVLFYISVGFLFILGRWGFKPESRQD